MTGCASTEEPQEPDSTSTTEAVPPTFSGTVTIRRSGYWRFVQGVLPRTVYNGEPCLEFGVTTDVDRDTQIVVTDSSGEVIGVASLGEGAVTDLRSEGFPLTRINWNANRTKAQADCIFDFTIDLIHESPFYTVGIESVNPEDRREVTYSHGELDSVGWVVNFTIP